MKRLLILFGALLLLTGCARGRAVLSESEPPPATPSVAEAAAPTDESGREPTGLYYIPGLKKKENVNKTLLYRACESMVQHAQFRGAIVGDFEIEDAGESADGWAQFRVTLHTDRGEYAVILKGNAQFVSDSIAPNAPSAPQGAAQTPASDEPTRGTAQTPPKEAVQEEDASGTSAPIETDAPSEPSASATDDEKPIEYYFPALQKKENMDNALLYRACEFMVQQYAQFRGAVVNDFEIESAGKSEDSWAQFRVTLYTDRGDYSVVLTENGRFVSDSLQ